MCAADQMLNDLSAITECDCFAMLIRGYIDDSSDEKKQTVAVAGAFVGDFGQWSKLVNPWRKRLRKDGLEYFKYSEYRSLRGQFSLFRDKVKYPKPKGSEAAKALLDDLEKIIADSNIRGMAHCIPLDIYKEVRATGDFAAKVFPKDAFEAALQSLIRDCAKSFIQHYGTKHRLAFMCDQGNDWKKIQAAYNGFKKVNPDFSHILHGPMVFGDDKLYPQLQAADLMAGVGKEIWGSDSNTHRLAPSIYFVREWSQLNMIETMKAQLLSLPLR